MCANPVDLFFHTISGPRLRRIVHWEDPERRRPDAARVGDRVTLLLRDHDERKDPCAPGCGEDLRDLQVWHKLAWIDPFYLDGDPRDACAIIY